MCCCCGPGAFAAHGIVTEQGRRQRGASFVGSFVSGEHFGCCVREYFFALVRTQQERERERR